MRLLALFFSLIVIGSTSWAQVANDECTAAIALGAVPTCSTQNYSNVGATASTGAIPSCFNGSTAQRDVWFTFQTSDVIRDVSIIINGQPNRPSGQPLRNPQVALYRGSCGSLSELACTTSMTGAAQVRLDGRNLARNTTYFVRVNDFSATANPNSGDFTICVKAFEPAFLMGQTRGSSSCFGTLYDSGGPTGNYKDQENYTFTICPDQPHACIELEMVDFATEGVDNLFGSDRINIYQGQTINGPLLASVYDVSDGTPFIIQAPGGCVTVQFLSDFFVNLPGFELRWQCSALPCDGSSAANPTRITGIPYSAGRLSTCSGKATVGESPCATDNFMAGPDYVFVYDSPGDQCIEIEVTDALKGTGVLVLDGPPGNPGSRCVAVAENGHILSANVQKAGTYYIVVAKARGCTDFNIAIREARCALSPALVDALRNPLNGCISEDGLPSIFVFEDGFQDMNLEYGVNSGCWLNVGDQADFYWFTIQSQTEGTLGFLLESADIPSDVDFNVWGPFTAEQVRNDAQGVIDYIASHQPIRSSWSAGPEPTGMVVTNPITKRPVTDAYDCEDNPGATGDDYISVIKTKPGEVYVILVNDWGNEIQNGGIAVDWSPSSLGLLDPAPPTIIQGDTAICRGDAAQILVDVGTSRIEWITGQESLSCTDCANPVARPTRTTTYTAVVESVCYSDTIEVTVEVFSLSAGPDLTVCRNETIQIVGGSDYPNASYAWSATPATGLQFSCTDCAAPLITALQPGTYTVRVTLRPDEGNCQFADQMTLTVLNAAAPKYTVREREVDICEGESVTIGVTEDEPGLSYEWYLDNTVVNRTATFEVSPAETSKYYVLINNATCAVPSVDSVLVRVSRRPQIEVANDTLLCIGDTIQLGFGPRERDVTYTWDGPEEVVDRTNPRTKAVPQLSGRYTLTAIRGACTESASFEVNVNPVNVEIFQGDSLFACLGTEYALAATVANPVGQSLLPTWTSSDPDFTSVQQEIIRVKPRDTTIYYATVSFQNCVQVDSIVVVVDSLPADLDILPRDTSICEGQYVVFRTTAYETSDYPNIEFKWLPQRGQQSPDSLLNMVVTPDTTTIYYRVTTNGGCRDSTGARVEVKPIPQLRVVPADTTVCFGQRVPLQLIGPPGLEKIMWMPPNGLSCTDCANPRLTALNSATYNVQAELNGCPGSAAANVQVIGPRYALTTRTLICRGESVTLNTVATPGATYRWTADDPAFPGSTDPRLTVTPNRTTTYFLRIESQECDPVEAQVTIQVVGPPTIQVSASAPRICEGESVLLRAQVTGGLPDDTFAWYILGNPTPLAANLEVTVFPTASNQYLFEYTSICGTFRNVVQVQVVPKIDDIIITANPAGEVPEGSQVLLNAVIQTDNPGPLTIQWTENGRPIPDSIGTRITVRPVIVPGEEGSTYTVTATTPEGCTFTATIVIPVRETQIVIPNAFTPGGTINNRFRPLPSGDIDRIVRFQIFNRWGQVVYNNESGDDGWDGTINGKPQPSDVYVYLLVVRTLSGVEKTYQGEVALIR